MTYIPTDTDHEWCEKMYRQLGVTLEQRYRIADEVRRERGALSTRPRRQPVEDRPRRTAEVIHLADYRPRPRRRRVHLEDAAVVLFPSRPRRRSRAR